MLIKPVIMVATHDYFEMPKKTGYLPVLVGAFKKEKENNGYQRDDFGENISEKNPYFCELTAIYWGWKNLKKADAVGLVHYRRFLYRNKPYNLENVITQTDIAELLKNNDVILPKKRKYYIETNFSHYVHAHHREPLIVLNNIIEEKYPEYLHSFKHVMHKRSAHMFNMFIMKNEQFNLYAQWLFGVLFEIENRIDVSNYSDQEKRVWGYISELLMDVWIEQNNIKYTEIAWGQIGQKHFFKKLTSFLFRKFGLGSNNKTHF